MKIICGVAVTMLFVMVSGQGGRLYTSNSNQAKSIATPFFGGQKQIKMIGIGGGPGKGFVDGYGQMYGGGFEKQYGSGYSMGYGSGYGMGYGSGYDMGYGGGYGMGFVGGYGPGYECLWSCRFRRVTHRIKVRK